MWFVRLTLASGLSLSVWGAAINDAVVPLATSGKGMRVDLQGVFLPDVSPTGEEETDQRPDTAYVDMFTLAPTYSQTDVSVPLDGGELSLAFKRRATTTVRNHLPMTTNATGPIQYPTENLLGQGWSTNLAARLVLSAEVTNSLLSFRAHVFDEDGMEYVYEENKGIFTPCIFNSLNNGALSAALVWETANQSIIFRKPHGLTMRFVKLRGFQTPITTSGIAPYDIYYRLDSISDRNGNTLKYEYAIAHGAISGATADHHGSSGPNGDLLPTRIYDAAQPARAINFVYGYDTNWDDTGYYNGASAYALPVVKFLWGAAWRLRSVTDPLGRIHRFFYTGRRAANEWVSGLLSSIQAPAMTPDGQSGPQVPTVSFTYHVAAIPDNRIKVFTSSPTSAGQMPPPILNGETGANVFVALRQITDPRGNRTLFSYEDEWQVAAAHNLSAIVGLSNYLVQRRIRLKEIVRQDAGAQSTGTAAFAVLNRSFSVTSTQVTDMEGHATRFDFNYQWENAKNYAGGFFAAVSQKRTHTGFTAVTYTFSGDANNNLLSVQDMAGTTTSYAYDSGVANDPYNAPLDPMHDHNDFSNPRRYQVFGKPAKRTVDAADGGLQLVTSYRYEKAFNQLQEITDATDSTTTHTFDAKGNRTSTTDALGGVTTCTYDAQGNPTQIKDPDLRITNITYAYTPTNLQLFRTVTTKVVGYASTPLNITNVEIRDVLGNVRTRRSARGFDTTFTYDSHNRLSTTTLPAVETVTSASKVSTASRFYDLAGNLVREVDHEGNATLMTYDWRGNVQAVRRRMNSPTANDTTDLVTTRSYDDLGLITSETDPLGRTTNYVYDSLTRLTRKTIPAVTLVTGSTPVSAKEEYFYDGENPGSGAWTIRSGWNPTRVVNPRGFFTDSAYDRAYRLIQRVHRSSVALASTSSDVAPRSTEPATTFIYTKAHKVAVQTVWSQSWNGVAHQEKPRSTYTYYDALHRPTLVVLDLSGGGAPIAPGTDVNDGIARGISDSSDIATRTAYDKSGNVVKTVDAEGAVTVTDIDGAGRPWRITQPKAAFYLPGAATPLVSKSPIVTYGYLQDLRETIVDANGAATKSFYDARDRLVKTIGDLNGDGIFTDQINGADRVQKSVYNLLGDVMRTQDSRGNVQDIAYDRAYRATRVTLAAVADAESGGAMIRPVTTTEYDKGGNVRLLTDARGVVTERTYDEWSRPRRMIVAKGTPVQLITEDAYDLNGNVVSKTCYNDAASGGNQTTTYTFDAFDRKTREVLPSPDGSTRDTNWIYLRSGEVCQQEDAKGQKINSDFDAAGRVKTMHFTAEPSRVFTYDRNGSITDVSDSSGESEYVYDDLRRVIKERRLNATAVGDDGQWTEVLNDYDPVGNRTRVQYLSAPMPTTLVTTYDRANQAVRVADGAKLTTYAYDTQGSRISQTNANATRTTWTFDALNRNISSLTVDGANGDALICSTFFTFDLVGNRRTMTEILPSLGERWVTYSYDAQYRLTMETW